MDDISSTPDLALISRPDSARRARCTVESEIRTLGVAPGFTDKRDDPSSYTPHPELTSQLAVPPNAIARRCPLVDGVDGRKPRPWVMKGRNGTLATVWATSPASRPRPHHRDCGSNSYCKQQAAGIADCRHVQHQRASFGFYHEFAGVAVRGSVRDWCGVQRTRMQSRRAEHNEMRSLLSKYFSCPGQSGTRVVYI